MALDRSQRLSTTSKPATELPLTPEDFFVLSRIDGRATVGEIIAASGLPSTTASAILDKLVELGAVETTGAKPPVPTPSRGKNGSNGHGGDAKSAAKSRRAAMLRAQFAGQKAKPSTGEPKRDVAARSESAVASSKEASAKAEDEAVKPDGMVRVIPVPPEDPRIDPSLDITIDDQRMLYATQDRLRQLSHFDLLGISPTNDKKLIRSAYHLISRKFHPDRYYNKNVGTLAPLLQELFKRAKSSLEVLMKDDLREAYVERYLEQRREEEKQRRAQEAQLEQEESKRREVEEARKRAEEEMAALEAQVAAKERAKRDHERRAKQQRRVAASKQAQKAERAKTYYDKGVAEMGGGRPGNAANMFRLALDLDPGNKDYESLWQQCLKEARVERAAKAFIQGARLEEMGQFADAARLFIEAAEANPTAEHLAEAAYAVREDDPFRAREFAMSALDAMAAAESAGHGLSRTKRGRVMICAGHAFLAAGQKASAKQQADAAHALLGDRPEVRALMSKLKKG